MYIIRKLLGQLGQYKLAAILAPIFTLAAVGLEVLIPYVMALLIDRGISVGDIGQVFKWGAIMLLCAMLALLVGASSGVFGSEAATGLAANLRDALFEKVQTYSFGNIDKFSTAGLVTRMTTDVTNVQNAFQMVLIIATRAPITLVASIVMCVLISPSLSVVFFVAMVTLGFALIYIMLKTMPMFGNVFRRYDDLNASVQENVTAIRVVKAFVREDHESEKFRHAANELHDLFVGAESLLAWNNPVMMCSMYGCIIALSWFGAHSILAGEIAKEKGYEQVLWLDGKENKYIEEVGSMNMFFKFKDALVTPPLLGSILGGITRDSIMKLAASMGVPVEERRLTVQDVFDAADNGTLEEAFGSGTAAVVSPVGRLAWNDREITISGGEIGTLTQKLYDTLTGIQFGKVEDPFGWIVKVD